MILNNTNYIAIFLALAIITFFLTPVFRYFAKKLSILDYPGGRKHQVLPVAYLGGVAIVIPITASSFFLVFFDLDKKLLEEMYIGIIVPSVIIAIVGLLDDIYNLSPKIRFLSQSFVGIVTSLFLFTNGSGVKVFHPELLNILITSLWVVGIINALNFIDNMDGLATGIVIISSLAFFIISFNNGQYLVAALSIALAGSCTGFIFWNKMPASIYLGDAGALYIGFLLAAISIRIDVNYLSQIDRIVIPILILIIPFIDTTQVVISRIYRGKSPFQGGRDHLSHLLQNKGLSEKRVVITIWLFAIIFAAIAIYLSKSIR